MRVRSLLPVILAALLGLSAAARPAAGELPEVVKRYVDELTLVVGRVDVAELSSAAVREFVADLLREAPERDRAGFLERVDEALAGMEETLAPLRERQVTSAWFIMGPASFMQGEPALFIVPVTDDAQAKAVTDLLAREREVHKRVDGAVLIGTRTSIRSAEGVRPVDRPVLARPFAKVRGGPALQVVFEPTPPIRLAAELGMRAIAAQSPEFPPQIIDLFAQMESLQYAISLPPRPRAALIVDFKDDQATEDGRKFFDEQVRKLQAQFERGGIEPEPASQLVAAFLPEVREKRVVLELTPDELRDTVGPTMVVTMIRGREGALRVRAGRNLKLLNQAILLWAYEKGDGRLPPELGSVEAMFTDPKVDGGTWQSVRRNPRYNAEDAFAYVRPADRLDQIKEPDITVIAYEKPPADGIRDGVNVGFADGHVEWLAAADFEELAKAQNFEIQRLPRR